MTQPSPRRLYMDNAATSFPKPASVLAAMTRYATELGASPGRGAYAEAVEASASGSGGAQRLALYTRVWTSALRGRPLDDLLERYEALASGSTRISSPGPASWMRHSLGQNVCSRMNSVSTATNSAPASRWQTDFRSSVEVITRMKQAI